MSKLGRGGWFGYLRKCCRLDMHCSLRVARLHASTWMDCCYALLSEPWSCLTEYLICCKPAFMFLMFCTVPCCGHFALTLACLVRLC